jgi:hypothetical protein
MEPETQGQGQGQEGQDELPPVETVALDLTQGDKGAPVPVPKEPKKCSVRNPCCCSMQVSVYSVAGASMMVSDSERDSESSSVNPEIPVFEHSFYPIYGLRIPILGKNSAVRSYAAYAILRRT